MTEAANKFKVPAGFVANTTNVMQLACNEERRAAVAFTQVIKGAEEQGQPLHRGGGGLQSETDFATNA